MADARISYQPTKGLTYDPSDPRYFDEASLNLEVERAFEICTGCRMCFKYCDLFPSLFEMLDQRYEGDVRKVTPDETSQLMRACFQCKLCEVECPYTPRIGHEFQLDFPKIVHRFRAVEARKLGYTLRDKVLGDPDLAGKAARASFGLANRMNRVRVHRYLMEAALGIHRDKLLPDFADEPFTAWAQKAGLVRDAKTASSATTTATTTGAAMKSDPQSETAPQNETASQGEATSRREGVPEVVLFATCFVEHNDPGLGRDTVFVLQKNGVDVACAAGLVCCGMPAWEHGDLKTLRAKAKTNLDRLMPFVEGGSKVLAVNPTCSMMLRREWPELLEGADRERAKRLSEAVRDPSEYLWSIRKEPRFCGTPASVPAGRIAYHAPCHLRAQGVGFRGREVLRKVLGVEVESTLECCGHDGTFAMTTEGFVPSQRLGKRAFDGLREAKAEVWSTDCPLAALQFEQHAGKKPLHPMSILARAYRGESFEKIP